MNISVDRRAALWMMILLVLIGITGATSGAEEGTPASAAFVPNELLIGCLLYTSARSGSLTADDSIKESGGKLHQEDVKISGRGERWTASEKGR